MSGLEEQQVRTQDPIYNLLTDRDWKDVYSRYAESTPYNSATEHSRVNLALLFDKPDHYQARFSLYSDTSTK